ncbi:MAG: 3-oxoacyl-ACP synthase III [Elusimicrobia bacterium]|nr:3-oxoacyl-ACP synthase III [Elusimicrobiota bacterium]
MRYSRVLVDAIGFELAPNVVSSVSLEERLAPIYRRLGLQPGQLEAFTGIRERRWWDAGFALSQGASAAALKALEGTGVRPADLGALVYAGVCRENFEPATACAVAERVGVGGSAAVYDLSNACLGVLNGMIEVANRIELGQLRAGLVVSCESAREINELAIDRMLQSPHIDSFKDSMATLTGGSGAVAVLLTDGSFGPGGHRLLGGALRAAPEHHRICRWGVDPVPDGLAHGGQVVAGAGRPPLAGDGGRPRHALMTEVMRTDAVAVLKNGVVLGRRTWEDFLRELGWRPQDVDKVICHQVGLVHQREILAAFGVPPSKDFTTFEHLGNIGTVSLPLTAALAAERGHLSAGDRVGLLGIGSGLNCLMLGLSW